MLVVDPRHWLNPDGSLPSNNWRVRRNALRVARLIEYGGNLAVDDTRETLVECTKRPGGKPCEGLLWVAKTDTKTIYAHCPICRRDEVVIHGWEETEWAEGMMEPVPITPPDGTLPS